MFRYGQGFQEGKMIKLVVIDDDDMICSNLKRFLDKKGYIVYTALTGEVGIKLIREISPHVVLLDIVLPDISGIEVLRQLKEHDMTIRVIMITAMTDKKIMEEANKLGASDYVTKPFTIDYLNNTVMNKVYAQIIDHQRETIVQIIYLLVEALEAKDKYTRGHSESVSKYILWIAEELKNRAEWKWVKEKIQFLKNVALLHDIGKIGVKNEILNKKDRLTDEEVKEIQKHVKVGSHILEKVDDLFHYTKVILHHHERWDGKGYPSGLKEKNIPAASRILAVADTYDAMSSERPYRKSLPIGEIISEIQKTKGKQFDPEVIDALVEALKRREIIKDGVNLGN
jgi:putative two-component system response regulator